MGTSSIVISVKKLRKPFQSMVSKIWGNDDSMQV